MLALFKALKFSSRNTCVYCWLGLKITFGKVLPQTIRVLFSSRKYLLSARPIPKPNTPKPSTFEFVIPFRAVPIALGKIEHLRIYNKLLVNLFAVRCTWRCARLVFGVCFQSVSPDKINELSVKFNEITKTIKQTSVSNSQLKIQELYSEYATIKENSLDRSRVKFAHLFNTWTTQNINMDTMQESFAIYTDEEYYEMFCIRDKSISKYKQLNEQKQMIIDISNDLDKFMKEQLS